jgi:hypothetical protein
MGIKMRYLYYSSKKKIADVGPFLKAKFDLQINSVDVIPPAYSCDKERIVILGLSLKGDLPDALRLFLRELTKARTANVALVIDGDPKTVPAVVSILKEAGTNVVGEPIYLKCGLFSGKLSDDEKAAVGSWVDGIVSALA